jgi:hypothetical protein
MRVLWRPERTPRPSAPRSAAPTARARRGPHRGHRFSGRRRRARPGCQRRPAPFRLRHRRRTARRAGRRLAGVAWDQCAAFHSLSPAAAAIEEIASVWTLELLGLPSTASVGFVTGGQGANTTGLAAARHAVFERVGWDVERNGLIGAPRPRLFCGEQAHATIYTALRLLGLGSDMAVRIPADDQGRMDPGALNAALAGSDGPAIVCAQAGNVSTGAFVDAHKPFRMTARAGWAAPPGTASTCCGCRSATGRPPTRMWIAPPPRSPQWSS